MSCNCISIFEEELLNYEGFNKDVLVASLIDVVFIFSPKSERQTITHVEFEIQGQKRKSKTKLIHKFCPFCGKKYKGE